MGTTRKLRIAIVSGSQAAPVFIVNLANGLRNAGHAVAMVGRDYGSYNRGGNFQTMITSYYRFNLIRLLLDGLVISVLNPGMVRKAWRCVNQTSPASLKVKNFIWYLKILSFRPDIIHFQWISQLLNYRQVLQMKHWKVVLSLRGTEMNVKGALDPLWRKQLGELLPQLDGIHAVSDQMARKAIGAGAMPDKTAVIYSVVPDLVFSRFKAAHHSQSRPYRFLSVGRFEWIKGYRTAVDAFYELRNTHPQIPFTYTIVAQGEVPNELLFQIEDYGLKENVVIINGLRHHEVLETMENSHALLLPSYIEGIANVVIEAMAVGLPVISSDCGGMSEVIQNGKDGIITRRLDSADLAKDIAAFCSWNEAQVDTIRQHAWARAKSLFSEQRQIARFEMLYKGSNHPHAK